MRPRTYTRAALLLLLPALLAGCSAHPSSYSAEQEQQMKSGPPQITPDQHAKMEEALKAGMSHSPTGAPPAAKP